MALSIAIAEDDADHLFFLQESLTGLGHSIAGTATSGEDLVALCENEKPDLVISDIRMPGMDGLEAAEKIYAAAPKPIIVATGQLDEAYIQRAASQHVMGFLVKPYTEMHLVPAIALALGRFSDLSKLQEENDLLSQTLKDRKIIERAKGLLMKQKSLSEDEAYRRLQKIARDKRTRVAEIAQAIVTADDAMQ